MKTVIWLLAGMLAIGTPLMRPASGGEHDDHGLEHGAETDGGHDGGAVALTPQQIEATGLVIETLQLQQLTAQILAPGEIRLNGYATTMVTPRIAAQIVKRHVVLGERVTEGQPLLTLSSVDMAQAQGDLLVAEREWRRVRKLGREVVSEQRYMEAQVAYEQARARAIAYGLTELDIEKLLDQGKAEMAAGRFQLLSTQNGTVIRDDFIVGEYIEPGRELLEISDESRLWVEARLTPEQAAEVRVGARATVVVRGENHHGEVIQVHHAIDENTRTMGMRIEIPNPDDRLHPGLFVQVRIEGVATEQVLAVPDDAVLRSPDGDWQVFVEHHSNEFEPREVEVARTAAGLTVIGGLEPGVRVVTRGAFFLQSELAKSGFEVHDH
jgi:cobalt-zinc-cadmium efflux system membrane fusion protein